MSLRKTILALALTGAAIPATFAHGVNNQVTDEIGLVPAAGQSSKASLGDKTTDDSTQNTVKSVVRKPVHGVYRTQRWP